MGKKLDLLIPEFLRAFHEEKFRMYISGSSSSFTTEGFTKTIYTLNKHGFLVYMSMMLKTLPDISNGVAIVGYFYQQSVDEPYVICDELGEVKGISSEFGKRFGVPSSYCCNLDEAIADFRLIDLTQQTPLKKQFTIAVENAAASVKHFEEKEWEVGVKLREKRLLT